MELSESICSLRFVDPADKSNVWIGVYAQHEQVQLAISLEDDGDANCFLDRATCAQLIEGLQDALARLR